MTTRDAVNALATLSTPTQSALIDARQRGEEAGRRDFNCRNFSDGFTPNPYKPNSETRLWQEWRAGYRASFDGPFCQRNEVKSIIMDDEDALKADIQALKQKCLMADRRRVEDSLRKNNLLSICFSALSIVPREHLSPELRTTLDSVQDQVEIELARKEGGV